MVLAARNEGPNEGAEQRLLLRNRKVKAGAQKYYARVPGDPQRAQRVIDRSTQSKGRDYQDFEKINW